jgi:hypothetical protein
MALSKRLRFEILRRDNHACRYCGRSAPEVKLHIDHVVPRVLGGTDEPSNLATSCDECNGGKSSSAPDQNVVDDVSQKTLQWSAAIAQAAEEMMAASGGRNELHEAVLAAWPNFYRNRIPADFSDTVDQFITAGLPGDVIVDMAKVAAYKPGVGDRWRYFCGCCWTRVRQLQDRAMEIVGSQSVDQEDDGVWEFTSAIADPDMVLGIILYHLDDPDIAPPPGVWVCPCPAEIEWRFADVLACQQNYPCPDPLCVASYGQYLSDYLDLAIAQLQRDGAVIEESDRLELVDG